MSPDLFVLATIIAHPNQAQQVCDAIKDALAPTRAEAGCRGYDLLADNGNDQRFVLQEKWLDKAALDAHFQTEHFKTLVERISPIASIEVVELKQLG